MDSLFGETEAPLAARMRPRSLGEYVGQEQIVGVLKQQVLGERNGQIKRATQGVGAAS